jgi:hypothetical protein
MLKQNGPSSLTWDVKGMADKAQTSMMEYLLLSFFILMVIIAMIFFLTFFQLSQLEMEKQSMNDQRLDSLLKRFMNSPVFVKQNSVFDDSKLMAIWSLQKSGICNDLSGLFGDDWFIELEVLNQHPGENIGECNAMNYPDCGYWSICAHPGISISKVIPVNIYRKAQERTDLGLLKVGVYNE